MNQAASDERGTEASSVRTTIFCLHSRFVNPKITFVKALLQIFPCAC